jgi:hypothetical protein
MAEIKTSHLQKILSALQKAKRKYVSLDDLSKMVGLYPEVLGADLTYFEPLVLMDSSLNMMDLVAPIESYLAEETERKKAEPTPKRVVASSKEMSEVPTIASFVYAKMTFAGGLVDPSSKLSDHDLHLLEKLVLREVKARKKHPAKRAKKTN